MGKSTTAAPKKTAAKKSAAKKTVAKKSAASKTAGKNNLVIVESPAKAKTINKYLGRDFKVLASVGHVRDLPKSKLGVDVDKDFAPEYVTIRGKKKVLDEIKSAAKNARAIYLATDPDREGEAIAWHIAEYLQLKDTPTYRAAFNEITQKAVNESIENPGSLNDNRCMAQQARRLLDRLVGYQISPLLWKNVRMGLSAGRVQSVAVRLLCEREAEIEAFEAEEYWTIDAEVKAQNPPPFTLRLQKIDGKKSRVPNQDEAFAIRDAVGREAFIVGDVEKKPQKKSPPPPYITSTLQQEAARRLRFSPNHTMAVAQGLYEGVNIGEEGSVGLITYMRTDSTRVADTALEGIRSYIHEKYGERFLPEKPRRFTGRKGAQDAHEAIRPTLTNRPPESLKAYLNDDQMALYELIWNRFTASQMAAAEMEKTTIFVPLCDARYLFTATGSVTTFPGFLALYEESKEKDEETEEDKAAVSKLPPVEKGEQLELQKLLPEQHFTQPPSRYSMSSLIRELERRGIGRPSTYASILSTIMGKDYAERVEGYFRPTELGRMVTDILMESFPEVLDVAFTAKMEEELDQVEEGERNWLDLMREFYGQFQERLTQAETSMRTPKTEEIPTEIDCEKCGHKMVIKWGRNGQFLACSHYPDCKNTKPFSKDEDGNIVPEELPKTDAVCDQCGKPFEVKEGRNGLFLACTGYPDCKNTRPIAELKDGVAVAEAALPETDATCPNCEKPMQVKRGRRGMFLACSGYPKCRTTANVAEVKDGKAVAEEMPQVDEKCEKCGAAMVVKNSRRGPFLACSGYPKCKNAKNLPDDHPAKQAAKKAAANKPQPVKTEEKCPKCGAEMMLRDGRHGPFLGCSAYPKCKTIEKVTPEILEKYRKEKG